MRLEYLTANDWALLRSKARNVSFDRGQAIIRINSQPAAMFILKHGSATVEITRGNVIARLTAGDICGEMAFIEHSVASASVIAETDTEVEVFELSELGAIFASYPHLEARFYRSMALLLSKRLRRTSAELARSLGKQ